MRLSTCSTILVTSFSRASSRAATLLVPSSSLAVWDMTAPKKTEGTTSRRSSAPRVHVSREGLLQYAEDGLQRVSCWELLRCSQPVAVATLLRIRVLPRPVRLTTTIPMGTAVVVVKSSTQGKPAHPPRGPLVLAQRAHSLQ